MANGDTRACGGCYGDAFLKRAITRNGQKAVCEYCGRTRNTLRREQLADLLETAISTHYERTASEPSPMAARIFDDWQQIYGHPIYFLETFIDPERFRGTCYRAANWVLMGRTTGRGKQSNSYVPNRSIKEVLGYPLTKRFRELLGERHEEDQAPHRREPGGAGPGAGRSAGSAVERV